VLAYEAEHGGVLERHAHPGAEKRRLRRERAAHRRGVVGLVADDSDRRRVDHAAALLGNDGEELVRLDAPGDERGNAPQRSPLARAFTTLSQVGSDHGLQADDPGTEPYRRLLRSVAKIPLPASVAGLGERAPDGGQSAVAPVIEHRRDR